MTPNPKRQMPHDPEAELGVIGGVMLRSEYLGLLANLEVDDFYDPRHKLVFGAIRNLEAKGRPIDYVTVCDEVAALDAIRCRDNEKSTPLRDHASEVVSNAMLRVPVAERVEEYAAIVKRHRVSRDVMLLAGDLSAKIMRGEVEGEDAVQELISTASRIETGNRDPMVSLGQLMVEELQQIEHDHAAIARGETVAGITTGLRPLDAMTGGIPLGIPTLVLARPGNGKTTFTQNLIRAAADAGEVPLFYSYEDGRSSFAQRGLAAASGVPTQSIRSRRLDEQQLRALYGPGMSAAAKRPEGIARARGMKVEELVRHVKGRRLRQGKRVGRLVVVDYIQAMPLPRIAGMKLSKNDAIGEISKQLADLAATENIAIVVCCQLNRELEGRDRKIPQLSDIRDCGELEQDGKLIFGLYRPWMYSAPPTLDLHDWEADCRRLEGQRDASGRPQKNPPRPDVAPDHLLEVHVLKNHQGAAHQHVELRWELPIHTITDSTDERRTQEAFWR